MKWRDKMKIRKIALLTMVGVISVLGFSCSKTGNEKKDLTMSKEAKAGKKAEYKKITSDEAKKMMETQKDSFFFLTKQEKETNIMNHFLCMFFHFL